MKQKIVLDMELQVADHHPHHQVVTEVVVHHVPIVSAVVKQLLRK